MFSLYTISFGYLIALSENWWLQLCLCFGIKRRMFVFVVCAILKSEPVERITSPATPRIISYTTLHHLDENRCKLTTINTLMWLNALPLVSRVVVVSLLPKPVHKL